MLPIVKRFFFSTNSHLPSLGGVHRGSRHSFDNSRRNKGNVSFQEGPSLRRNMSMGQRDYQVQSNYRRTSSRIVSKRYRDSRHTHDSSQRSRKGHSMTRTLPQANVRVTNNFFMFLLRPIGPHTRYSSRRKRTRNGINRGSTHSSREWVSLKGGSRGKGPRSGFKGRSKGMSGTIRSSPVFVAMFIGNRHHNHTRGNKRHHKGRSSSGYVNRHLHRVTIVGGLKMPFGHRTYPRDIRTKIIRKMRDRSGGKRMGRNRRYRDMEGGRVTAPYFLRHYLLSTPRSPSDAKGWR